MSVGILSGLLQYFPENRGILVQKLGAEKKLSKSVSGNFTTKKKKNKKFLWSLSPREGAGWEGKVLMAWQLREELFFAASLSGWQTNKAPAGLSSRLKIERVFTLFWFMIMYACSSDRLSSSLEAGLGARSGLFFQKVWGGGGTVDYWTLWRGHPTGVYLIFQTKLVLLKRLILIMLPGKNFFFCIRPFIQELINAD